MDYILYNNDGSIKLTNFTEFINKGSNNVNKIFVGLTKDSTVDLSTYDVYAVFKLPNGQAEPVIGTLVSDGKEIEEIDETWYGYEILLGQDVTCFAGLVKCTIRVEKNDEILYTYPVILTVNDTAISPADLTLANLSQYENLKTYVYGLISDLPYSTFVTTNTDQYITAPKTFTTYVVFKHANTAKYGIDVNEEGESLRFSVLTSPDDYYSPLEIAYDRVWTTVPLYISGEFSLYNDAAGNGEYVGFYYTDIGHICLYYAPYDSDYNGGEGGYLKHEYYFQEKNGYIALLEDCGAKLYQHILTFVISGIYYHFTIINKYDKEYNISSFSSGVIRDAINIIRGTTEGLNNAGNYVFLAYYRIDYVYFINTLNNSVVDFDFDNTITSVSDTVTEL